MADQGAKQRQGQARSARQIALVTLLLGLFGAMIWLVIDVGHRFEDVRRSALDDSRWGVLQSEVDTLKLQLAVTQAQAAPDPAALQDVRRRFDVLFSRISLYQTSELYEPLHDIPSIAKPYQEVQAFLDHWAPVIDAPDGVMAARLGDLAAALPALREQARSIAVLSLAEFAAKADERRLHILLTLIALALTTAVLVTALSLLATVLSRLYKRSQFQAQQMRLTGARMSAIIASSADAVIVTNRGGWIIEFNPAAERMFGYARPEALGRRAEDFLFPPELADQQREALERAARRTATDGIAPFTLELEAMRHDGSRLPVEISVAASALTSGSVVVAFVRDITERREAEATLRTARDRAMGGEQAKARFIAVMSHEMRTPLNGLIGSMSLFDDTELSDEQRELMAMMRSSGQILLDHVNSVLDISRAEAAPGRAQQVAFDADRLIEDCLANQSGLAAAGGNQLTMLAPDGPLGWVQGDPVALRQVMLNLISNAVKFTRKGLISVEVERLPEAIDGRSLVEIRVADTGPGVAEQDQARIFDDFVTLDTSYGRPTGGTGLGLGIARRLVETMGGEIGVESEPGLGSLFWMRLPLPRAEPPQLEPARDLPRLPRLSILVIEDNDINRALLVRMLRGWGHRVVEAENGLIGVARAATTGFDVILTDIAMPHLDGIETTWRIRNSNGPSAQARIIALTAHALPSEMVRFRAAGMDDCLIKPVSQQNLLAALDGRRARAADIGLGHMPLTEPRILRDLATRLGQPRLQGLLRSLHSEADEAIPRLARLAGQAATDEDLAACHRLAGGCGTFGLPRLTRQLNTLETALKHDNTDQIRRLASALPGLWTATQQALATELALAFPD